MNKTQTYGKNTRTVIVSVGEAGAWIVEYQDASAKIGEAKFKAFKDAASAVRQWIDNEHQTKP